MSNVHAPGSPPTVMVYGYPFLTRRDTYIGSSQYIPSKTPKRRRKPAGVGVHILELKTAPLPTFFPETEEFFRVHLLVGDIILSQKLICLAKRCTPNAFRVNFPFWAYILTGQPPNQLHSSCITAPCRWCSILFRQRPYCDEHTRSHPNSEVKHRKARSVLGWGTAWEVLRVLLAFCQSNSDLSCVIRNSSREI